ncbi:MAG TPA: DUF6194 family protein [Pseudonocardiaceae bacterium]|nr:DUF6194 family protein [Pseudonocardiaceae bacterium]
MDFTDPERIITFVSEQLPGAVIDRASEASGAPEIAWGDTFIFAAPGDRMPFATIVIKDYPGFDTQSNLDRPGAFRLNIGVGKAKFTELIGYPPAEHAAHATEFDYTAFDTLIPHPAYAIQAWVSIVNPGPNTTELAATLLMERARAERPGIRTSPSTVPDFWRD